MFTNVWYLLCRRGHGTFTMCVCPSEKRRTLRQRKGGERALPVIGLSGLFCISLRANDGVASNFAYVPFYANKFVWKWSEELGKRCFASKALACHSLMARHILENFCAQAKLKVFFLPVKLWPQPTRIRPRIRAQCIGRGALNELLNRLLPYIDDSRRIW